MSELQQLVKIISDSVNAIEKATNGVYPALDNPFNPFSDEERIASSPGAILPALDAVAACAQLIANIQIPALSLYQHVGGFYVSAALKAVLDGNVVEILREAGPKGAHVKDIAARNGADAGKLARILRLLATHHVFREVEPDVFANNRLSSLMDTLKSVEALKSTKPEDKHTGTPGVAALVEHSTDEMFKGAVILSDTLYNPNLGHSQAAEDAPAMVALKTGKPLFPWFTQPENKFRLNRFMSAMEGVTRVEPESAILMGFDWGSLPENSTVVDVGGSTGVLCLKIAKSEAGKKNKLKFVVQDLPPMIEGAKEFWKGEMPTAVNDGIVSLQVHDFFTPQPVKDASVYLLRMIMHDYGSEKAHQILSHLRASATPSTQLLIIDQVSAYACRETGDVGAGIPGAVDPLPPTPLLANRGKASAMAYVGDFQMYVGLNGVERTIGEFIELLDKSGWKMKQVYFIPGSLHKQILAVPA